MLIAGCNGYRIMRIVLGLVPMILAFTMKFCLPSGMKSHRKLKALSTTQRTPALESSKTNTSVHQYILYLFCHLSYFLCPVCHNVLNLYRLWIIYTAADASWPGHHCNWELVLNWFFSPVKLSTKHFLSIEFRLSSSPLCSFFHFAKPGDV